jgi:hypothetical protein
MSEAINEKVQANLPKPLDTEKNKPLLSDFQPKSLLEAVRILLNHMSASDYLYIKTHGLSVHHHGFGMAIRNEWGLWRDSELALHFKNVYGLGHADDMSGMIFAGLEAEIQGKEFDADKKAQYYKDYWLSQGVDPLTLKRAA